MKRIEVGTIFKSIYSADFFEVVKATAKTVTVKPLETERVGVAKVYTAHSYETEVMPLAGHHTRCLYWSDETSAKGKMCRIFDSCPSMPGQAYIRIADTVWAVPWDGSAATVDHYS